MIDSGHSQREEINELTRNQHLNCIRSMARNDDQKRKYEFLAYYWLSIFLINYVKLYKGSWTNNHKNSPFLCRIIDKSKIPFIIEREPEFPTALIIHSSTSAKYKRASVNAETSHLFTHPVLDFRSVNNKFAFSRQTNFRVHSKFNQIHQLG